MSAPSTATRPQDPWETTWIINHEINDDEKGGKKIVPLPTPLSFKLEKAVFHVSMEAYKCTLSQGSSNNSLNTRFNSGLRFFHFRGDQLTLAALPPLEFPIAKYDANWQHISTINERLRGAYSATTERLIAVHEKTYVVLYRAPKTVKSKNPDYIDDILLYEFIDFQGRPETYGEHESGAGGGYSTRP